MQLAKLTLKSLRARPVVLKLKRPVVARIATITDWPLILIDLFTEEGIVGRSYLEPYTPKTMRYLIPALHDLGDMLKGHQVSPAELYALARKSLHFVGYEGLSLIAVSGLDMAAWDALAKAAGAPLCVLLGGSVGPVNPTTAMDCGSGNRRRWQPRRSSCATKEASRASSCGLAPNASGVVWRRLPLSGMRSAMTCI